MVWNMGLFGHDPDAYGSLTGPGGSLNGCDAVMAGSSVDDWRPNGSSRRGSVGAWLSNGSRNRGRHLRRVSAPSGAGIEHFGEHQQVVVLSLAESSGSAKTWEKRCAIPRHTAIRRLSWFPPSKGGVLEAE